MIAVALSVLTPAVAAVALGLAVVAWLHQTTAQAAYRVAATALAAVVLSGIAVVVHLLDVAQDGWGQPLVWICATAPPAYGVVIWRWIGAQRAALAEQTDVPR